MACASAIGPRTRSRAGSAPRSRWCKLDGFAKRAIHQLSGGQQQRVALARAMVIEPDLLLMDEPLGALDRQLRKHVQLEIRRLHLASRRTTIYVTHDQEEALVMSDRIAVMSQGRIEQVGTPTELYRSPRNVFVATFLGEFEPASGCDLGAQAGGCYISRGGLRSGLAGVEPPGPARRRRRHAAGAAGGLLARRRQENPALPARWPRPSISAN